jgi:hypothetical protein
MPAASRSQDPDRRGVPGLIGYDEGELVARDRRPGLDDRLVRA